ncbi:MAG TPA: toprim domain-containing protein [Bacteroidales bacterium]|nr:toprim domain-containing protein [Bacteroidales bacterium]HQN81393.1 toprim domain-containing protein [Bacteroidales bacterium]HQP63628.1 toprim domain-containing protein [Bacteroidales bacterium]
MTNPITTYTEDNFQTLEWNEHIRLRPGMYIGKLGDGSTPDDGLYILIKEVIDNSVDEYAMGYGKVITVTIADNVISVRDYGRGIPFGKVIEAANKMNTGAKYDNKSFQKAVGLNGVGLKAVNATSIMFYIESFREGKSRFGKFSKGLLLEEGERETGQKDGTLVEFTPDPALFNSYHINLDFVWEMVRHYAYLNKGLRMQLNGTEFVSKNGLLDLVNESMAEETLYPPIHITGQDIEMVITHSNDTGESIMSFANGQNTSQGGTHLSAFREAVARTIKEFYKKDFEPSDIRQSIVGAVSIRLIEPRFANQTKTILDSKEMSNAGPSLRSFIGDFVKEHLDNYLHRNPETADILLKKIIENEKERKAVGLVRKKAKENAKKISLHNRKLRDCRIHLTDKHELAGQTMIFITEGDSASGSITKSRDPNIQAVFSLRGKPENTFGLSKQVVYTNEEFNLLQAALNIEDDLDNLRYNKIIIATDADPDGMHIRMLLLSFFLQFFPELVRHGHIYILQTPLFRVRNKKETRYCYSETEKEKALRDLGPDPEITRFKGLGEISPDEFKGFIGENIRLDIVRLDKDDRLPELLRFYMGDNTPERREFIVNNLRMVGD